MSTPATTEAFEPTRVFEFAHPYPHPDAEDRFEMLMDMFGLDPEMITEQQEWMILSEFQNAPSITEFESRIKDEEPSRSRSLEAYPEREALYAREVIIPGLARVELVESAHELADRLPSKAHRFEAKRRILAVTKRSVDAELLLSTAEEETGNWLIDGHSCDYWPDVVIDALEYGGHVEVARRAAEQAESPGPHHALLWLAIHERSGAQEDIDRAIEALNERPFV